MFVVHRTRKLLDQVTERTTAPPAPATPTTAHCARSPTDSSASSTAACATARPTKNTPPGGHRLAAAA